MKFDKDASLRRSIQVDRLADEFEIAFRSGERPEIDRYLMEYPEIRESLFRELVQLEMDLKQAAGEQPKIAEYRDRYPNEISLVQKLLGPATEALDATVRNREDSDHQDQVEGSRDREFRVESDRIGPYRLLNPIGRGGMGIVFRALDQELNREVALKIIRNPEFATEELKTRFEREAHSAARLSHRNIITVYEYGAEGNLPYIAMEFVEGQTLAERLRSDGAMPPSQAASLLRQIASAVGYAHDNGIIHRDLKPANILIDNEGLPRVADFGLARAELESSSLTETGRILGTPSYMSPEQAAGRSQSVDRRSDIYSLGAILYECLTGRPPFAAASPHLTLLQVLETSVTSPRAYRKELSRDIESVCLKCLEKLPEHRYANAHELVAELDRLIQEQPVLARSRTLVERTQSLIRDHVALLSVAAALVATFPFFFLPQVPQKVLAVKEESHRDAIAFLSTLIEENPTNPVPWLSRAEHHFANHDLQKAKSDALQAIALDYAPPRQPHLLLGNCALEAKDYLTAETEFGITVMLDASCWEGWLGLGRAHSENGELQISLEDFHEAIRQKPDCREAYEWRATLLEKTGSIEKAKVDRAIIEKLSKNPSAAF